MPFIYLGSLQANFFRYRIYSLLTPQTVFFKFFFQVLKLVSILSLPLDFIWIFFFLKHPTIRKICYFSLFHLLHWFMFVFGIFIMITLVKILHRRGRSPFKIIFILNCLLFYILLALWDKFFVFQVNFERKWSRICPKIF